jgi:hypothetical protein
MVTHSSWAVLSCAADVVRPRTCMDVVAHNLLCCNRTHAATLLMARCSLLSSTTDVPQTEKQLQATMEPDGAEVEKKEVCAAPCV